MPEHFAAFYRGHGRFADWVVRAATRSAFSHVELIRSETRPRLGDTVRCLGASGRDGGVRVKDIMLDPAKWNVYHIRWAPPDAWDRAEARLGEPFDLLSMLTTQLFNFRRARRGRWFCSELVAYALRLDMPHAYAPGDLLRAINDHTDTWDAAHARLRAKRAPITMEDEAEGLAP